MGIMTEKTEVRKETVKGKSNEWYTMPVLTLIVAVILVPCSVFYANTSRTKSETNVPVKLEEEIKKIVSLPKNSSKKLPITSHPNCTMQEHIYQTLKDISAELYLRKVLCTPEDINNVKKHDVPISNIKKTAEPRAPLIIYFAVGLLMASLVVAFLDVYKVKGKPSKSKPPLTKRCSLADLTVLRHNRRESMKKDYMVDDHRVPLKLLGSRPLPDNRRCSVPIYFGEITYGKVSPRQNSRKSSLDYEAQTNDYCHSRTRLMRRF